jgi:putative endonuclease
LSSSTVEKSLTKKQKDVKENIVLFEFLSNPFQSFQMVEAARMNKKEWIVYLVRCADESLYCGITNDIEKRLIAHNSGKGAKYTKSRIPVEMAGVSSKMTKSEALKLERHIKQVPAGKKVLELTQKTPL